MNWHPRVVCRHLDRLIKGEITRLMLFMPPRSGKSELVSRRLPAYVLGKNPDARVMACSHTAQLAGRMNRDVHRIIDSKPRQGRHGPLHNANAVSNTKRWSYVIQYIVNR